MAKILVVDDNNDTLYILGRILRNNSYEVLECRDGVEALEAVKMFKPNLILLDIRMPRMDGYETCMRLRSEEETKTIPIIIQTATATDVPAKIRGFDMGATDYIVFPINFNELLARISTQLRIQKLEVELRETERLKVLNETAWTMQHEINNPLAVIHGWTQILLGKTSLDKETINGLEKIKISALRIKEVVQKLTRITRYVKTHTFGGSDDMIDVDQADSS